VIDNAAGDWPIWLKMTGYIVLSFCSLVQLVLCCVVFYWMQCYCVFSFLFYFSFFYRAVVSAFGLTVLCNYCRAVLAYCGK